MQLLQATTATVPPLPRVLPALLLLSGERIQTSDQPNDQEGGVNVNINVNFNIYPAPPPVHAFHPTPTVMGEYPGHPGGHHVQYPGGQLHSPPYPAFYPPYPPFHPSPYNHTGEGSVNIGFLYIHEQDLLVCPPHYASL